MDAALHALLEHARNDPHVAGVLQFGSSARGEPARDTDVAVVLRRTAVERRDQISLAYHAFGSDRPHAGLDVSVFQDLPIYVRKRALEDARVLLARDEEELYAVARDTVREFDDYRPHYEAYLEAVARGGP